MLSNESMAPNQSALSRPPVSPMQAAMVWNNVDNRGCPCCLSSDGIQQFFGVARFLLSRTQEKIR
jgi:hypothetical protein